jgi:hypothetical protein
MFKSHNRRKLNTMGAIATALAVGCGLLIAPATPVGAATNTTTARSALRPPPAGAAPYAGTKGKYTHVSRAGAGKTRAGSDSQTLIDFSNLADGTVVTDQYPGVTFSSTPGNVNYVSDQSGYNTPSFICTGPTGGSIDCTADTIMDFATPVSGLTFDAVGVNDTGVQVAEVEVYGSDGLIATVPIIGDGGGYTAQLVDLSAYSGITSIDITDITDPAGIGWTNFSYTQNPCADNYQTTVTEHAGTDSILELYTDTVTFSWCTDGNGQVQISSSSQTPTVESSGLSFDGAQIKVLNLAGFTFGVTPATPPVPAIDNEPTYATTTASGLSFNEQFDLGGDLAKLLNTFVTDGLAKGLVVLIRSGKLGSLSIELMHDWGTIVSAFDAWARANFGLPAWAANYVANLPIGKIKDAVRDLAGQFVTSLTQSLEALGQNATFASVVNALRSGVQQIASALVFTAVDWAPQIIVRVDSSLTPSVDNGNTMTGLGISVGDPIVTTTPTN